jgi:hypothetical protein
MTGNHLPQVRTTLRKQGIVLDSSLMKLLLKVAVIQHNAFHNVL